MQINILGTGSADPNQKRKIKQHLEKKIVECLNELLSENQQATCKVTVDIKKVEANKVK